MVQSICPGGNPAGAAGRAAHRPGRKSKEAFRLAGFFPYQVRVSEGQEERVKRL